jgi:hypothetical protein
LAQLKSIDAHATWNVLKKRQNLMEGTTNPFYYSSLSPSLNFTLLVKNGHFAISPYD